MFLGSLWMTSQFYWSDKYNTARGLVVSDFERPGGGRYDVIRQHMTTPCYLLRLLISRSVWNHSLIIHIWYWILISNLYLTFDNQEQLPMFKISSDIRARLLRFHKYTFDFTTRPYYDIHENWHFTNTDETTVWYLLLLLLPRQRVFSNDCTKVISWRLFS